jgi:hypothetical protein
MTERVSKWQPTLLTPENTVMLPIASSRPLNDVAREGAAMLLGPGADKKQLHALERVIKHATIAARQRHPRLAGLIFFPDYTRLPPIADIDVHGIYSESGEPLALDFFRQTYGTPDKRTLGEIEVTEVELPAGPALRFHKRWAQKPDWRGVSTMREDITYAIRPPQIDEGVVMFVSWVEPTFSEALIKSADAIAQTIEIKLDEYS